MEIIMDFVKILVIIGCVILVYLLGALFSPFKSETKYDGELQVIFDEENNKYIYRFVTYVDPDTFDTRRDLNFKVINTREKHP